MNKVLLSGRLTDDPKLMRTTTGKAYCFYTLACQKFSSNDGQSADFISCVAWEKMAENLAKYMRKGGRVNIIGKLQTRKQQNTGNYVMEVVTESVEFVDTKQEKEAAPQDFVGDIDIPY